MSRTKIVCTIGPASRSPETIERLILAGMDVARLNFSHGSHEEHLETIGRIRAAADRTGRAIAILQDLGGPKIRIGAFAESRIHLEDGASFTLTTRPVEGSEQEVSVSYPGLPAEVTPGDLLMLADGVLELRVVEVTDTEILCRVEVGGILSSNKGINLPSSQTRLPCMTEKDKTDLAFGLCQGVDYVALSFVRRGDDVRQAKQRIVDHGADTLLIAKIEKHEAVDNIDDIIEAADGIMVARGDLGIEIPLETVPVVQKSVIAKANAAAKPVITATQMLGSMVTHPRPTRAEVTDVANAILDGTDAIMLSEETAVGEYPVGTVTIMQRICNQTELGFPYEQWTHRYDVGQSESIPEAISHAACQLSETMNVPAIVVFTGRGSTAHLIAKFRPAARVVAVTPLPVAYRQLALVWGVVPMVIDPLQSADKSVALAMDIARDSGRVQSGERFIITGGVPVGTTGTTNSITTAILQ